MALNSAYTHTVAPPYEPEHARPFQANLARGVALWSTLAGALVVTLLAAGWLVGLREIDTAPPAIALGFFFLALAPIGRYIVKNEDSWSHSRDMKVAGLLVTLDIGTGAFVLFWTGGPESVLIVLVPLLPFALRLLGNIWYSVAYTVAIAAGFAIMIIGERLGFLRHAASLLDAAVISHGQATGLLVFTTTAAVVSATILADAIAKIVTRRETEAIAFSEKMNTRAEELALLLRIGRVLSRSADFEVAAREALDHVHAHFRPAATVLYLKDPHTGLLAVLSSLGEWAGDERSETTLASTALDAREAHMYPEAAAGGRSRHSTMIAPLLVEDTGYGAIKVVGQPGRTFDRSKLALLETIASELAATVRSASNYQSANAELTRAGAELAALNTFTRSVSSSLDLDNICHNLLSTAMRLTGADSGLVTILSSDGNADISIFRNYEPTTERLLRSTDWRRSRGLFGRALRTGRPVVVGDVSLDSEYESIVPAVRSKVCVPIVVQGDVVGMVSLESRATDAYSPNDVDFLAAMAESAAVAVKNARLYRTLEESAIRDGLTGLYNHSYFHQAFADELERAIRYGRKVSLLLLDLDDFKGYNDRHGHQAGDRMLGWLGGELLANTRRADTVARYGGEEFAIVMSDTAHDQAIEAARKLQSAIDAGQAGRCDERVTLSLGISTFAADGTTPTELIAAADRRMYRAKHEGRNRVVAVG